MIDTDLQNTSVLKRFSGRHTEYRQEKDGRLEKIKPLPAYLLQRYNGWHAADWNENSGWYKRLMTEGQRPRAMLISCCDSRVNMGSVFGAEAGDFFIHRNIASLVPPYKPDGNHHGTGAAIEYAVTALHVAHLIIVGHSGCGGVAGCHAMCSGAAPDMEESSSFVGRWMDILRPGYERVRNSGDDAAQIAALEKEAVMVSLENLISYPFVSDARQAGDLSLHGLWIDVGSGELQQYDAPAQKFVSV